MNIIEYLNSVNIEKFVKNEQVAAQRILLSELSYASFEDQSKYILVWSDVFPLVQFHKLAGSDKFQYRCTFNMPTYAVENPQEKPEQKRKKRDKSKIFKEVYELSALGGDITKHILPLLAKITKSWRYIASWFGDMYRFFLCNAKGTPAYNKKVYWRIHDACATFDKKYKACFFITLTLDQKKYEKDFIKAWKSINSYLGFFAKKLTQRFGGKYVVVLESHKTGFPHAHMLFYTDYEFKDMKYKYSKKQRASFATSGELRDFLTQYWTLGFSQVDKNRRKDTANYLSKYISKVQEGDVRQLLGSSRLTESERKEILTLILPIIADVRSYKISRLDTKEEIAAQRNKADSVKCVEVVSSETSPTQLPPLRGVEIDKAQAYLKTLCNKSPLNCANNIFSHQRGELIKKYKLEPSEYHRFSLKKNKQIAESGARLSCKGCILSRLANLYVNNDTSLLEKRQNWFYFADLWRARTKQNKTIERWYVEQHVTDVNKDYFINMLYKKFEKLLPKEEVLMFCTALYTLDPILIPFVLPSHQVELARTFTEWETKEADKFTQEEVLGLKALCNAAFNV